MASKITYAPTDWQNARDGGTALESNNLNNIEEGIKQVTKLANSLVDDNAETLTKINNIISSVNLNIESLHTKVNSLSSNLDSLSSSVSKQDMVLLGSWSPWCSGSKSLSQNISNFSEIIIEYILATNDGSFNPESTGRQYRAILGSQYAVRNPNEYDFAITDFYTWTPTYKHLYVSSMKCTLSDTSISTVYRNTYAFDNGSSSSPVRYLGDWNTDKEVTGIYITKVYGKK